MTFNLEDFRDSYPKPWDTYSVYDSNHVEILVDGMRCNIDLDDLLEYIKALEEENIRLTSENTAMKEASQRKYKVVTSPLTVTQGASATLDINLNCLREIAGWEPMEMGALLNPPGESRDIIRRDDGRSE